MIIPKKADIEKDHIDLDENSTAWVLFINFEPENKPYWIPTSNYLLQKLWDSPFKEFFEDVAHFDPIQGNEIYMSIHGDDYQWTKNEEFVFALLRVIWDREIEWL